MLQIVWTVEWRPHDLNQRSLRLGCALEHIKRRNAWTRRDDAQPQPRARPINFIVQSRIRNNSHFIDFYSKRN